MYPLGSAPRPKILYFMQAADLRESRPVPGALQSCEGDAPRGLSTQNRLVFFHNFFMKHWHLLQHGKKIA